MHNSVHTVDGCLHRILDSDILIQLCLDCTLSTTYEDLRYNEQNTSIFMTTGGQLEIPTANTHNPFV